jgi:hypothetical protein
LTTYLRHIVSLGLLQKADYHEERQMEIDQLMYQNKGILQKYREVTLAKTLLSHINDLEFFF